MSEEKNEITFVNTNDITAAASAVVTLEEVAKKMAQNPLYESERLEKLFEALSKAQGEMEVAKEDSTNPYFKSQYADLASVIRCSRPYLSKHGLCIIQRVMANGDGRSYLFTRLCHSSGQWMESRMILLLIKTDMQGMGSAISYAKRYSYSSILGIATGEDDDGNGACEKPKKEEKSLKYISQPQAKTILELIDKNGNGNLLDQVLSYYNISKLSYLAPSLYDQCIRLIQKHGDKK